MTAVTTATEFNQHPSRILGRVERGDTLTIEKHGNPVAMILPLPRQTSGGDLARRLHGMKPDPETADELDKIVEGMNDTSRHSHPD